MLFFRNGGNHVIEINYIGNLTEAIYAMINNGESIGKGYILSDEPKITYKEFVNTLAKELGHKEVRLSLPYSLSYSAALILEWIYKLLHLRQRPLLTRQAVILLGNNILYDITNLKSIGYRQKYQFMDVVKHLF
jgi:nucleoside-diphosphate-sugar epimerase